MGLTLPIYLDHNATTPVDPRVLDAMLPWFTQQFGNAASRDHAFGHAAASAVKEARQQVAKLLNCQPEEIIWTSGATESNNLAIKGIAAGHAGKGRHLLTQATEHKAVLDPFARLAREGFNTTILPVDALGRISVNELAASLRPDTILVSIMLANNETGTLQPIHQVGQICRERGILFHVDATQAVGHIPVDVQADCIDLLSLSGHKFYGPKGCGALYVRRRPSLKLLPLLDGGRHERGYRSGTLNVPGIVGVGKAAEIAQAEMPQHSQRLSALRDQFEQTLLREVPFVTVNGDPAHRLPHTTNLSFAYIEGESIMLALDDVAVSSGSACTSASLEPSHVLEAMGVKSTLIHSAIRFGLGRSTTAEQLNYVATKLAKAVYRLREMSPLYEMAMEGIDPETVQWTPHK